MMAAMQEKEVTVTAQEKWATADKYTREKMLALISWFSADANKSWKKLPHNAKTMLSMKTWTK